MTKLGQGRHQNHVGERGFTLIEVSIIVMALAILSAILLPQVGVFLRDARFARVREDVAAIGAAMMYMLKDTGESSFQSKPMGGASWRSPERYSEDGGAPPVGLLIGDGDTPDGGSQFYEWREPLGSTVGDAGTDFPDVWLSGGIVDTFANHLIQNYPGDLGDGGAGPEWKRYRTPADMVSRRSQLRRAWRAAVRRQQRPGLQLGVRLARPLPSTQYARIRGATATWPTSLGSPCPRAATRSALSGR